MSKRGKAKDKSQSRKSVGPSKEQALAKWNTQGGQSPTPTPYVGEKPYQPTGNFNQASPEVGPLASKANEGNAPANKKGRSWSPGQQHYAGGELTNTGRPDQGSPDNDNNPYTVNNLSDFDLAAGGAGAKKGTQRLSKSDLKRLSKQGGFSKEELVEYANNLNVDGPGAGGGGAQKLLKKWTDRINNKPPGEGDTPPGNDVPTPPDTSIPTPVDPGKPGPDMPTPTQPVKPTPYQPPGTPGIGSGNSQEQIVDQTVSQDRNFGDVNNTIGDGNTIIGSNLGNQDFSVNIGMNQNSQNMGNNSGGISQVDPLANMMGAQAYSALNDNAWAKSQAMLNGTTGAATASQLNETLNNTNAKVGSYDYASRMNAKNMLMMGRQMTNDTLGDIWSFQAPEWQMPEAPSKIESNAEEIGKEYSDKIDKVKI